MLIFSQIYFQEKCTCNACEKPGKKVSNTHRYSARDSLSLSLLLSLLLFLLLLLCALVKVDWILLVSIFVLDTLSGRAVCSAARSALCWEHKKHCEIAWVAMARERERRQREREGDSEAVALEAWHACCSHALSWFFSLSTISCISPVAAVSLFHWKWKSRTGKFRQFRSPYGETAAGLLPRLPQPPRTPVCVRGR